MSTVYSHQFKQKEASLATLVLLVANATLKIYAGAPHGLAYTHQDQLNTDLLAFLKT